MRQNYNSFEYWKNFIMENRTIRGHMFMKNLPTDKSVYMHTLIFSKYGGLNSIWAYFPNIKVFIGYIQYSFLQEAFYTWINCKYGPISYVPIKPVEEIINDGESSEKITREEADKMRKNVSDLKRFWDFPNDKAIREVKKFLREFNRTWYGDSREFLYIKMFETSEELGKFVLESSYMSSGQEEINKKTDKELKKWLDICKNTTTDRKSGELFRNVLQKNLTEVI